MNTAWIERAARHGAVALRVMAVAAAMQAVQAAPAPAAPPTPGPTPVAPAAETLPETDPCELPHARDLLVGPGELALWVSPARFVQLQQSHLAGTLHPYIDGVDVSTGTTLTFVQPAQTAGSPLRCGQLRYQLHTELDSTATLLSRLYRENLLITPGAQPVALVASSDKQAVTLLSSMRNVVVTTKAGYASGLVGMVLVLLAFLWLLLRRDTFRDAAPEWLVLARAHQDSYLRAAPADRPALLTTLLGGGALPAYDPAALPRYVLIASKVRSWEDVGPDVKVQEIAVGLLLQLTTSANTAPLPKVSYSLARLQSGLWFTFTMAASIFLGIVYWQLPPISGSMLGILGITVVGTTVSFQLDKEAAGSVGYASRGLLNDLVTGRDDRTHVHRYQSLAVNLMLLCYAVHSVWHDLQLPTFDPTWLGFLGVSAGFNALGKQTLENK